jgi:hypothetical protein
VLGFLVLLAASPPVARAAPPTPATAEIGYLIEYLERSGCEFYRNGRWYDAAAASAHLRHKYDALSGIHQFNTADDFIERVATRSSMSGLAYEVRCGGHESRTAESWLREALVAYRAEGHHASRAVPPEDSTGL